ncbi:glucan endo-1,3-beta-glucosidase-like [Corylus avellana]|uniref:glucan endo-1,3-beta-glucosidase-like n=1 Tax=Corylus avellana TaxID=13451 RepID=UPI00286A30A3|nr:glucan endo-1,3-beta-glucosidase-like [Corylus avellana]
MAAILLLLGLLITSLGKSATQSVGICYGQIAKDLPPPAEVIDLCKANDIERFIGNEIKPNDTIAPYVLPATLDIRASLASEEIKVLTAIDMTLLESSYPPSTGSFSDVATSYMNQIVAFLATTGAPLLANVYSYYSYMHNTQTIDRNYALFTSPGVVVRDGNLEYQNLFVATMDALYSALKKVSGANMGVVISESGSSFPGGIAAAVENAGTYYSNLIRYFKNGTPKRLGYLETYLFAMFNENQKGPAESEINFGLFFPNKQPKYQLTSFTSQSNLFLPS